MNSINRIDIFVHPMLPFIHGEYKASCLETRELVIVQDKTDIIHNKQDNSFLVSKEVFELLKVAYENNN